MGTIARASKNSTLIDHKLGCLICLKVALHPFYQNKVKATAKPLHTHAH